MRARVKLRRAFVIVAAGFVVAGTLTFVSGAAAFATATPNEQSYAAAATTYQNATIAGVLAASHSGTRIGPSRVEWNGGAVIMTVPASPEASPGSCPRPSLTHIYGWTCVYDSVNFHGVRLQFADCCYYQNLRAYGGARWASRSYSNTRPFRSWLNQYTSGDHGHSLCMEPNAAAGTIAESIRPDEWILLTNNRAHC
jgi:hypothetical protein